MNVQRYGIAPDYVYGHDKFGPVNQGTEKPYYVLESAFDRVTSERDALQLRLNAVEEENDRLRSALRTIRNHTSVSGNQIDMIDEALEKRP